MQEPLVAYISSLSSWSKASCWALLIISEETMCTQLKLPLNSYDPNITKPGLKLNTSYLIQNHIAYNTAVASLNKKQLNKHGLGKAGGGR